MYINPRDLAEEFDIPPFHLLHNPPPFLTMPAARRTRSGRAAPSAPTKRIRTKGGCLTCRIRRKKCDESREHLNGGCETCARLHIECLGYANKRPEWLKGAQVDDYKRRIKHFLADHNAKSASRGQDDAFLTLHDLRESPLPPRQHSESVHSDSDSDSLSDLSSVPDVKQPELSPLYIPQESVAEMPVWAYWGNQDSTPVDSYPMMPTPYGYYDDLEASPVTEEYSYGLHPGYPEAALLSDSMPNNSEPYAFDQMGDEGIQVLLGSYEHPSTEQGSPIRDEMIWAAFLQNVERLHLNKHHPDTAAAIADVLLFQTTGGNDLSQPQHMAMQHLLRSRYTPSDARAVTATWMMIDSLRQGTPDHWCEYLDIILHGYFDEILRASVSSSSLFSVLGDAESTVIRHGLWSDLVASATTRRPPCQIDLYRKVLPSADVELLGFPNKVALAFAETAALAARPELIPQARPNLARYRADLEAPSKDTKAAVHTAGVRLYLETVASRGSTDSALVKDAVKNVCRLVNSAKEPRRGFAFWIFLAGCHAVEDWPACRQLMDELKTGEDDNAIGVASDIMDEAHRARQQGTKSSEFCWTEQLRRRGTIIL